RGGGLVPLPPLRPQGAAQRHPRRSPAAQRPGQAGPARPPGAGDTVRGSNPVTDGTTGLSPESGRYRPPALLAGSPRPHAAGVLALAAAPRHWPAVAATLFADHLVLTAASFWPRGSWVGPN